MHYCPSLTRPCQGKESDPCQVQGTLYICIALRKADYLPWRLKRSSTFIIMTQYGHQVPLHNVHSYIQLHWLRVYAALIRHNRLSLSYISTAHFVQQYLNIYTLQYIYTLVPQNAIRRYADMKFDDQRVNIKQSSTPMHWVIHAYVVVLCAR